MEHWPKNIKHFFRWYGFRWYFSGKKKVMMVYHIAISLYQRLIPTKKNQACRTAKQIQPITFYGEFTLLSLTPVILLVCKLHGSASPAGIQMRTISGCRCYLEVQDT